MFKDYVEVELNLPDDLLKQLETSANERGVDLESYCLILLYKGVTSK